MPSGYGLSGVFRDEEGATVYTQSLEEHSTNVAAYSSRQGEKIDLPVTAYLGGLLHDAGKAKKAFSDYILEEDEEKREMLRGSIVHSRAGALILEKCLRDFDGAKFASNHNCTTESALLAAKLTAEMLQAAIMGHHTGLTDCYQNDGTYMLPQKAHEFEKEDMPAVAAFHNIMPLESIKTLFNVAVEEILRINDKIRSVALLQSNDVSPLTKYQPNAGMSFFLRSLLAKWITSAIVDAERYDYANAGKNIHAVIDGDDWTVPRSVWENAANAAGRHGILEGIESLPGCDKLLTDHLLSLCGTSGANARGLYSFVAPLGDWKTIGFLRFALEHAAKEGHERIIYVAANDQTVGKAAETIRYAVGTANADTMVSEFHADVFDDILDYDETNIPLRESLERWRKPIVVTTQRLFMDMVFSKNGTDFRRFQSTANAIVLFEDVQALPAKLTYMFTAVCEFLRGVTNCTVVIGSGTETGLDKLPFWKLNLSGDIRGTGRLDLHTANARRNIVDMNDEGKFSPGRLAELVLDDAHKRVLVVLNTAEGAERTFSSLYTTSTASTELSLLTERMCNAHIQTRMDDIDIAFKSRSWARKHIVVCTPEIALSRNWQVDAVYRARAGLDDVLNLAYRCIQSDVSKCLDIKVFNGAEALEDTICWKKAGYEAVLAHPRKNLWESLDSFDATDAYIKALTKAAENPQSGKLLLYPHPGYNGAQLSVGDTIVDVFGPNAAAHNRSHERGHPLRGAFGMASAGYFYDVQPSTPVIVPYDDDAKRLIHELVSPELHNIRRSDLIRQAQKYTVRVPDVELRSLKDTGMIRRLKRRVYICDADWYDKDGSGLLRANSLPTNKE